MTITTPFIEEISQRGKADTDRTLFSTPFLMETVPNSISLAEAILASRAEPEDLDYLESVELDREANLRNRALSVATDIPLDDETWRILNRIRHRLIEKELESGLSDADEIFLGTLEVLAEGQLKRSDVLNFEKAERILKELEGL